MFARLALLAVCAAVCINALPGIPTFLDVPLNRTLYPNGVKANTTRGATYEVIPVDMYAFYVPENAVQVMISLTTPDDPNSSYLKYDYSTLGPLCSYRYQVDATGYTCSGLTSSAYVYTSGDTYNITINADGLQEDASSETGIRWKTGRYHYFGLTADSGNSNLNLYGIQYIINEITITTCPTGYIGGIDRSDNPLCLPLVVVPANNTTPFAYVGNYTGDTVGMAFEVMVPANAGLMEVILMVPAAQTTGGFSTYFRGSSFGFPGSDSSDYECGSSSSDSTEGTMSIARWYCRSPIAGRFYVSFRNYYLNSFNGTFMVNYTSCSGNGSGPDCGYTSFDLGNAIGPNNSSTMMYSTTYYTYGEFKLTIPAMTLYGFNVSIYCSESGTVYNRPNGYASSDSSYGYPNSNFYDSCSSTSPAVFVFLPQTNYPGLTTYFSTPYDSDGNNITIVMSSSGTVVPPSTSTSSTMTTGTGTSSSTGTRSSSTTMSGTRSSSTTMSGTSSSSRSMSSSNTRTGSTTTGEKSDATTVMACVALTLAALLL